MGRSSKGYLATAVTAAAVTALLGIRPAFAAEPTTAELIDQIQQLKAKVERLETTQNQQEATSAREVDATVERVLNDSEKRSQLLQMEGFTAGYTKGKFIIQDAAGNWVLHPYFQFQYRSTTNWRNDGKHGNESDWENGFSIPRFKMGFDGSAFTPALTYNFLWNTSTTTGGLNLEQAWVKYMFSDGWFVRAGQIINPAFHEQSMGSRTLLAADRSLANQLIGGVNEARTQAVTLIHEDANSPIWAEFGIEDGFNSQNTTFTDPGAGGSTDWGVTGRLNYFITGDTKEYGDFSAIGNKADLFVVGAAGDITQNGDQTSYIHIVDTQWENTNGLGLYAAYYANYIDDNQNGTNYYNWSVLVQGNYMIQPHWELFARYDMTKFDSNFVASGEGTEYCEAVVGATWFIFGGHNAKITLDFTWLPNGAPSTLGGNPIDLSNIGILGSNDQEFMFRTQFQLLL